MEEQFNSIEKKLNEVGITSTSGIYSESLINDIEGEYHFTLPSNYRKFLIKYGNVDFAHEVCYLSLNQSPLSDTDHDEIIDGFYGLQDDVDNLTRNIESYLERMPENLIPIAECPGGDQLCIGVRGDELGKIYFWNHNLEQLEPLSEDLWYNVNLISNSFYDFILSFKIRTEKELGNLGIVGVKMSAEFLALLKDK